MSTSSFANNSVTIIILLGCKRKVKVQSWGVEAPKIFYCKMLRPVLQDLCLDYWWSIMGGVWCPTAWHGLIYYYKFKICGIVKHTTKWIATPGWETLLSLLGSSLVVPSAKVNQVPSASSQTCPFACNRWGFISPIRNMALNHQNKHLPWWCKYFLNWTSIKSCVYLHCLLRDTDCSRKTCHLWMGWSSLFTCILNEI